MHPKSWTDFWRCIFSWQKTELITKQFNIFLSKLWGSLHSKIKWQSGISDTTIARTPRWGIERENECGLRRCKREPTSWLFWKQDKRTSRACGLSSGKLRKALTESKKPLHRTGRRVSCCPFALETGILRSHLRGQAPERGLFSCPKQQYQKKF